jgi:hypothetical protein
MALFNTPTSSGHDDYFTPKHVWEDIKEHIPDKVIWEAFYGTGRSAGYLRELGFTVVSEDVDFFESDMGEIIVSNPPFSKIKEVMVRLFELDKPFIMLMPAGKLATQHFRQWKDNGLQIIIPKKRINFDKMVNGEISKNKSASNFDCYYYCYKMDLPLDLMWL